MKEFIQKIYAYVLPVAGGSTGAVWHVETSATVLNISVLQTLEVAFYAAVGAFVGYLVKRLLDMVLDKKKDG